MNSGSDPGLERLLKKQAERTLVRLDNGGFRIEAPGNDTIHVEPVNEGWRVAGRGHREGWKLTRETVDEGGGLRLDAGSEWLGRSMALAGTAEVPGLRHLLLADGRLFRMMFCRPRNACFELRGWETSGAYVLARPHASRATCWTMASTTAGEALVDSGALQILFAAEIEQSDSGYEPAPANRPGGT